MTPSSLKPYLKAIAPALVTVLAVLTQWIASGSLDTVSLRIALAGLVTTGLVYFLPNTPLPVAVKIAAPATPRVAPPAAPVTPPGPTSVTKGSPPAAPTS